MSLTGPTKLITIDEVLLTNSSTDICRNTAIHNHNDHPITESLIVVLVVAIVKVIVVRSSQLLVVIIKVAAAEIVKVVVVSGNDGSRSGSSS